MTINLIGREERNGIQDYEQVGYLRPKRPKMEGGKYHRD